MNQAQEGKRRRRGAWPIVVGATALAIVATRLLFIATSINLLHPVFNEEMMAFALARDVAGETADAPAHPWRDIATNLERYLPSRVQFHGILLLNNLWLALLAGVAGLRYANAHVVALGYQLVIYLCWASLLRRHAGARVATLFSLLYVLAPFGWLAGGLFLSSSHLEGTALLSLGLWLALGMNRRWCGLAFAATFGLFFFFYKGYALALPLLFYVFLRRLQSTGERCAALPLLAVGFAPLLWIEHRFGYFSANLVDSCYGEAGCTWFDVLGIRNLHLPQVMLPPTEAWLPRVPYVSPVVFAALFAAAYLTTLVWVARAWRQGTRPPAVELAVAVVGYPLMLWGALALGALETVPRFLLPLYPFTMATIALALDRWRPPVRLTALAVWAVFYAATPLLLIRPAQADLALRYDGLRYFDTPIYTETGDPWEAQLRVVRDGEVDFMNWALAACPDNRGFRVIHGKPRLDFRFGTLTLSDDTEPYAARVRHFASEGEASAGDLAALGMSLVQRKDGDVDAADQALAEWTLPPDVREKVRAGFRLADPPWLCP